MTKQLSSAAQAVLSAYARAALARWAYPAAAPAPWSERPWERDGWCYGQGRCWWGRQETYDWYPDWTLATYQAIQDSCGHSYMTVCLPANALPLPAPKGGEPPQ